MGYYDEVEIEDFVWDPVARTFHYPCPCGDRFEITKLMLRDGEDIATCPSCSLIVRVIFDPLDWEDYEESEDDDEEGEASEAESDASGVSFHSAKEDGAAQVTTVVEEVKEGQADEVARALGGMQLGKA